MYRNLASTLIVAVFFSASALYAQPPAPPTSVTPQIKANTLKPAAPMFTLGSALPMAR